MTQPTITGQQWRDLPVPELGQWTPQQRVCVVLPARDNQAELDRTLAALGRQTYPAELLEVVVVDDASPVPLVVPELAPPSTRILRVEEGQKHGSGRARDRGARSTDAETILFLDSDMIVDQWHVEAHARWHHVCPYAVVLGRKWFVETDGITPEQVAEAVAVDGLEELLGDRPREGHTWQENFIKRRKMLTQDLDDTFISVVGADISIGRELYERSGGFAAFGVRGIVDTEFGYRAFTAGGLVIPDQEALAYHQGPRTFSNRREEIKWERHGLVANHLPIPMFRTIGTGRQWAVPRIRALVDASGAEPADVVVTVDTLLGSAFADLHVDVAGDVPAWLREYYAHEGRVGFAPPADAFPSPFTLHVSPGVQLAPTTLGDAVERLASVPALRAEVAPGLHLTMRTTRSVRRAELTGTEPPAPTPVDPAALGVARAAHHLTSQGMVALDAPPEPARPAAAAPAQNKPTPSKPTTTPAKKKQQAPLSIPARARRKARHLAGRLRRALRG